MFAWLLWGQVIVGAVEAHTAHICIWDTFAYLTLASWQNKPLQSPNPPICVQVESLAAGARHLYQVRLSNGEEVSGAFYTPPQHPLRVAFLSCHDLTPTSSDQTRLYKLIQSYRPHLIIHLGDWGYPDTTEPNFPPSTRFFPEKWENLQDLYRRRYIDPHLQPLFREAAWAYMYDDHDYAADNTGKNYRAQYRTLKVPVGDYPFSPAIRENAMRAYRQYFPHYPLEDTSEALYQRFRWGDVEFFLIDDRSARTGTMKVFELGETGLYYFRPKPEISLLGQRQREWLLSALRSSTARWKVILSGVTYNRNLQLIIQQVLSLPKQLFSVAGGLFRIPSIFMAGSVADTWAGYPHDQDTLLAWCWRHGITGVMVVSGDTHIGTLEDGTMGGLPELMTGGAGKTEKRSYRLARRLGIVTFNRGGQGISYKDFRPAFGLIDFYSDSAHTRLISARGRVLAEMRCRAQDSVLPPPLWERLQTPNIGLMFELTPSSPYAYKLRWRMPQRMPQVLTFRLYDSQGRVVWEAPSAPATYWRKQKELRLPPSLQGSFFLRAEAPGAYYGVRLHMP